jgi:hypothetical protein
MKSADDRILPVERDRRRRRVFHPHVPLFQAAINHQDIAPQSKRKVRTAMFRASGVIADPESLSRFP